MVWNNERMRSLLNIDGSLLNNIDKLIAVADPCDLYMWRKKQNPSHAVVCSCSSVFQVQKSCVLSSMSFVACFIFPHLFWGLQK